METKDMICICCPMGCALRVTRDGEKISVTGFTCKRGEAYGIQEMRCPMRTVTSSVRVNGGVRPVSAQAPVHIGDVLAENIAGTGANLVATAND